jgi:hypothetical protein
MGLSLGAQAEALGKNFVQYAIPTREWARPFTHVPPKYSSSERVVVFENSVKKMHRWNGSVSQRKRTGRELLLARRCCLSEGPGTACTALCFWLLTWPLAYAMQLAS